MSEEKIEVGQVWRERDNRYERFVRINDVQNGRAHCQTCDAGGEVLRGSPRTRIRLGNLRRRFTLVTPSLP